MRTRLSVPTAIVGILLSATQNSTLLGRLIATCWDDREVGFQRGLVKKAFTVKTPSSCDLLSAMFSCVMEDDYVIRTAHAEVEAGAWVWLSTSTIRLLEAMQHHVTVLFGIQCCILQLTPL